MKIAILDHPFHEHTKSTQFLISLLQTRYDVSTFFIGVDDRHIVKEVAESDFDLYVLLQSEYLAPYLIALEKRVLCVPMFDGSGALDENFWKLLAGCWFLNFSQFLHHRVQVHGCPSLYVQYMKNPKDFVKVADYSISKAIFWSRRPDHGYDAKFARKLIGPTVSLHVHNAPDNQNSDSTAKLEADSVSYRDLTGDNFNCAMNKSNIFISPRGSEGIGMALMEALARGMVVIANNQPTHTDYIENWISGRLLDYNSVNLLSWPIDVDDTQRNQILVREAYSLKALQVDKSLSVMEQLGVMARRKAISTYQHWLKSKEQILELCLKVEPIIQGPVTSKHADTLLDKSWVWHSDPHLAVAQLLSLE